MIRRVLTAVILVVVAVILLVIAWPQLFHAEWLPLIVQVVSLRAVCVAIAIALLVLLAVVAAVFRRSRRFVSSVAILIVVFCVISLAVLSTRGFGGETFAAKTPTDLTVVSWNTLGDAPGAGAIATLALAEKADIITLPETSRAMGVEVATLMGKGGRPMWAYTNSFDEISKSRSTTLLISAALGTYTVQEDRGNTSVLPTVIATPDSGAGPTIIAVHPVAPQLAELSHWRSDLTWLASQCDGANTIMAGDFNSTVDHYGRLTSGAGKNFGQCADGAVAMKSAAIGTWPTKLPPLLGTPIDHVMATKNWTFTGMRVVQNLDDSGSDHRPIVAQLSLTG
ncbi:endonuclease/exonuclease/phosphatase family protein [Glaciihabitans sp. dw_435]|uniref:endonuclease/exonuclease/phosphatase family protein n=1 Tax=Glaciihabitans sp. dw_435 TaxID=2720081 RepID=UPI001BD31B17|nr:endonuclease/exonuclease/phosphatase family protein [Glaciihabitans sp. dw_435]